MSGLGTRILEQLRTSGLGDVDQRSALGMARTWVEKQKPISRSQISGYEKRDDLAEALVAVLGASGAAPEAMRESLNEARKAINTPHRQAAATAAGGKHITLVKPKEGGN